MELIALLWRYGREDIHLMRGISPPVSAPASAPIPLANRLEVKFKPDSASPAEFADLATFLAAFRVSNPNAECTFRPTFKAILDGSTNDYEGFGVKVNKYTGVVSAGPDPNTSPAAPRLYNFTVLATLVADPTDAASPRKQAYLRFHVHNHVAKAWLSPHQFKVPKNINGFSFAVYAQFDDKTIIRLERWNVYIWVSDPPGKVDADYGSLSFDNTDADGAAVNVSAILTDEFVDGTGGHVAVVGVAIPYTLPQVVQLIPGSAGYDRRNEVPNFIFLAEGFQSGPHGDETKFDTMIDDFLTNLRQKGMFKPFDHLVGRMNFWKVFVPSAARGIGTRYEVFGEGRASPIPEFDETFEIENDSPTSESDLNTGAWGPNQVRLYFGLPMTEHKGMLPDDIKEYWRQSSRLPDWLIDEVPDPLVEEWKQMGDRRMVDDSDTFIGIYYGAPTKAKAVSGEDTSIFMQILERFSRYRLNRFLVGLQHRDENGVLHPVGPVWDIDPPVPGGKPAGKDYDNVVILLCSNWGRERNDLGQLYTNVIDAKQVYMVADTRYILDIEADTAVNAGFPDGRAVKVADLDASRLLPDKMPLSARTTLLHEIGHSMGLGDEYGEGGIPKDSSLFQFSGTGDIENDKHYSNVQVKSDLVVSPGADDLDAEKVKWRWHRIAKSGVLAPLVPPAPAAITQSGAQYTIKLRPGQAAVFKEHEVVFLRRRRLGESILKDIEYSEILPRYPFVTRSPRLRVLHVDAVASEVVVEPVDAGALTGHVLADDFPAECVLYKPLPARTVIYAFPPAGASLELTAANVLSFIDRTGRPLHEKKDEHGHLDLDFEAEQSPDLADITVALCAKKNRNVVGLYAGGNQYHHGVYHPTGHCMMRSDHLAEFCSVCKYILTEFIDPSLHPEVDVLIEEYYPLKVNQ